VVTIGNYDGIHRGQTSVLRRTVERARDLNLLAVVVTFEPHPLSVLRNRKPPKRLTTEAQKVRYLEALDLDVVLLVRFTRRFSQLTAEEFVQGFLAGRLAAKEVYVGEGFSFGRERRGDLELLSQAGEAVHLEAFAVKEERFQDRRISSSRIRECIAGGALEEAGAMLGRAYAVEGIVVKGDGRGRRLGWPTINLETDNELLPGDGVYVSRVTIGTGEHDLGGVTNVGTRPTVYMQTRRLMETFILDFDRSIYGERIELEFLHRLRDEMAFPTLDDLSDQIGKDVEAAREYFRRQDC
jgi:riboflavin kinase/FMN adenylyltransferase